MLKNYTYPGNVRELENIIMSAVSLTDREHVLTEKQLHLPDVELEKKGSAAGYDPSAQSLDEYLRICEEQILRRCMAENEGNISAAARQLGIKRQTLQHKLKKYKI